MSRRDMADLPYPADGRDRYWYARSSLGWAVCGPNGVEFDIGDKLLALAIAKFLSGHHEYADGLRKDWEGSNGAS